MFKKIALSLCFTLFLGLLSACSPSKTLRLTRNESTSAQTASKTERTNGKNTPDGIGTPIALPPRFDDEPLKPGQTKAELMPNGLPALSPMKGINYNTLFAEKIKDKNERFERVENAVLDLRKEFETYKPAIVRLAAVESDIQGLIKELEVLLQETPTPQPPLDLVDGAETEDTQKAEDAVLDIGQLNPQPATPPNITQEQNKHPDKHQEPPHTPSEKHSAPSPVYWHGPDERPKEPTNTPAVVTTNRQDDERARAMNFRIGQHEDRLRIAFDTNEDTPFTIELDNDEHLIIVELSQAFWDGEKNRTFPDSALLDTLSVEPINEDQGSMVILSLKKDTKILQRKHLSPDKTTNYHRVYFDLSL